MLQKLKMAMNNKNAINGHSDDVSMLSLEKQNTVVVEGIIFYYCVCNSILNIQIFMFSGLRFVG